jgi:peroxiredoxin Q/BCP
MLMVGARAPEFSLLDDAGTRQTLSALLGEGPLVLYFYPADFTPGCTREACDFRDLHGQLLAAGLRVVGVSPQDVASHARFKSQHALPFSLLADSDKAVVRAYDVGGPMGFGVRRATYLIGRDGRILAAVLADFRIARHREFVERAIRSAATPGAQAG